MRLSASERREVRYPVGPFAFLEKGNLLTVSSSPPSLLPQTSAFSARSLTLTRSQLILLWSLFRFQPQHPQPCSIASSWLIWLCLFWALRWVVRLTYLSLGWNVDRNWWNVNRNWQNLEGLGSSQFFSASILLPSIYRLLLTLLKLTPRKTQSYKSYCFRPATVIGGELS